MSNHSNVPSSEELREYYESLPAHWSGADPSQFVGVNHPYCTEPLVPPCVLTPISLPDSSFRPSPALSHPEDYQDYQYSINDSIPGSQGLGISAPFPNEFPRTSAPTSNYLFAPVPGDAHHGMTQTPNQSPQGPPSHKRAKRQSSGSSSREPHAHTPVNILPDPEGVIKMEKDRQNPQPINMPPKPRAPGRGRRDPQAEEEDAFVENLRNDNVAWKRVREEFQQRFHKDASEARLQMRLLRRQRERLTHWDSSDVQILIKAHDLWEKEKYHFLSNKIKELGAMRSYSPDQCRTQIRLLETKQHHRDRISASPSALSDPVPMTPHLSRKRQRAQSFELEFDIEGSFF
ncbi:unnamed protein product [Penicillium salamii]|uniref:Uncharacterized protein n=1 Tax=Penicillium salamii TaxID=1612424 RepID=A0A9W4ISH1_9EURO|nr:unnamed protein product [Penicillium salamii]